MIPKTDTHIHDCHVYTTSNYRNRWKDRHSDTRLSVLYSDALIDHGATMPFCVK